MAQGTNYFGNRIGNSVKLQNMFFRIKLQIGTAASRTLTRVIVFRDLDGYGVQPTITDILASSGTTTSVLYPKSFLNSERFSFLYDELVDLNISDKQLVSLDIQIPHEGHVKYLGTTSTAGSNGKGSVYIAFICDESTLVPSYAFHSRVFFTDD